MRPIVLRGHAHVMGNKAPQVQVALDIAISDGCSGRCFEQPYTFQAHDSNSGEGEPSDQHVLLVDGHANERVVVVGWVGR